MTTPLWARLLAAAALLAFATLAQAQYLWIDAKGVKQLSDQPPPASVPLKNILKAPRGTPTAATEENAPAATQEAAKPKAAPTMADRNADYRKRVKEANEREQKDKDEEAAKADQLENCQRARSAKQSLDSGVRIGIQDKNGERVILSDEQRALETKKIDKMLAACK